MLTSLLQAPCNMFDFKIQIETKTRLDRAKLVIDLNLVFMNIKKKQGNLDLRKNLKWPTGPQ